MLRICGTLAYNMGMWLTLLFLIEDLRGKGNNKNDVRKDKGTINTSNSYAHVVKGGSPVNGEVDKNPALVLLMDELIKVGQTIRSSPYFLCESKHDYGPVPFLFFQYWLEVDGFEKLVNETWSKAPVDMWNAMLNLMKKLKYLKKKIRAWNNDMRRYSKNSKLTFKAELENLDSIIDKGEGNDDIINKRMAVVKSIQELDKL
nr:RNA-directed DNA polymerase, eukaryota, reverse transcriptase zinc-binding domain protein [Tanacetum cinerariifolium]